MVLRGRKERGSKRKLWLSLLFILFIALNSLLAFSAFRLGRFSNKEIVDAIAMPSPNSTPILISVLALLISVANFIYTIRLNKEKSENECAKARAELLNKMSSLLDSYQTYIRHERELITDARIRNSEHVEVFQESLDSEKKAYDKLFDEYLDMRTNRKPMKMAELLMRQHEIEAKKANMDARVEFVAKQVEDIYAEKRARRDALTEKIEKALGASEKV